MATTERPSVSILEAAKALETARATTEYYESCLNSWVHDTRDWDSKIVAAHNKALAAGLSPYLLMGISSLAYSAGMTARREAQTVDQPS